MLVLRLGIALKNKNIHLMDSAKQQLVEKLKSSNNVLVTVSRNPTVDQLAALVGLSLLLNKEGKHCAAVFSGQIPSTLEFLKPDETIEKNTDSLRDFIIALDKSKADKLRYKVEDNIVRIFITPYRTSISQADLEFSQGDFNVDLVIGLGVKQQEDLDEAITAHGRILHDATVASINISNEGGLGSISWHEPTASSLAELVTELAGSLRPDILDEQIATALLTGIVAETERFSNDKTSSQTMSLAAKLMSAGANQQLVATKLEEPAGEQASTGISGVSPVADDETGSSDGTLQIKHSDSAEPPAEAVDDPAKDIDIELPAPADSEVKDETPIPEPVEQVPSVSAGPKLVTEPPTLGGTLTANSAEPKLDPVTDPLSLPTTEPPQLLERKADPLPPPNVSQVDATEPLPPTVTQASSDWALSDSSAVPPPPSSGGTLSELEEAVKSPHLKDQKLDSSTESAREEVNRALSALSNQTPPTPIAALNAQPLGPDLHPAPAPTPPPVSTDTSATPDSNQPPPVPPPIPFDFGKPAAS